MHLTNLLYLAANFYLFVVSSSAVSLYSPDDPLWELDSSNFYRIVLRKSNAWIIEFYNSWCGHCIRFAPTWKEFSRDTRTWRNVIDVGVVNCAESENAKLCRDYNVDSYPTIRLFWTHINETDKGIPLPGNRDIASMESSIINFLESHWSSGVPKIWPSLLPIETEDVESISRLIPADEESILIFVESPTSLVGRKVILDLSSQKNLIVRRVLSTNKNLLNDMKLDDPNSSFPLLLKISRNGDVVQLFSFSENISSTYIRDEVFKHVVGHPRISSDENITIIEGNKTKARPDVVYIADLENAVHYSLRQEVGVHNTISGPSLTALKSFLLVLKKYFPGNRPIMVYLARLNKFMSNINDTISGEDFLGVMDHLQDEENFLPEMQDWVGCKGSQEKYRGYPCSLWTLFHTLTVQAYIMYEDGRSIANEDVIQVLLAVKGYVRYFFTCAECSHNFGLMAENLENEVNSSRDVVLWLWRAHNKVNARLAGDVTEDPQHPKIQFPLVKACPKCQISGQWDESFVLRYLLYFYSKKNIVRDISAHAVDHTSTGPILVPGLSFEVATIWMILSMLLK